MVAARRRLEPVRNAMSLRKRFRELISALCFIVSPMSSSPSSRRVRSEADMSKVICRPFGPAISCFSRSTVKGAAPLAAKTAASSASACASGSVMGRMPFCRQFSRYISAKERAMMQVTPMARKVQTADSRELPQPKLRPERRMAPVRNCGRLKVKSAISAPSAPRRRWRKSVSA